MLLAFVAWPFIYANLVVFIPGWGTHDMGATDGDNAAASTSGATNGENTPSSNDTSQNVTIDTIRRMSDGEKRLVSILFADVVGSTAKLKNLDADEAREFIDNAIDRIKNGVHAFGGSVLRVQGDGVMAVFGARVAYEDHALRAAKAAFEIKNAFVTKDGDPFGTDVRIGVHSGPVLLRWQSNDFGKMLDVVGPVAHIAAHIEQKCPPDRVLVSSHTLELLPGRNEASVASKIPAAETDEDIDVFELHTLASDFSVDQYFRGKAVNDLVGRVEVIAKLEAFIDSARRGENNIIGLIGEAGIGKSRLVYEATMHAIRNNISFSELRGLAIDKDTPFKALKGLIAENIPSHTVHDHWQRQSELAAFGLDDDEALAIMALLGNPQAEQGVWAQLSPDERNRRTIGAATKLLITKAAKVPKIIIVEDVHFMDSETQKFLRTLCQTSNDTKLSLVMTGRPEAKALITALSSPTICLEPLGKEDAVELVRNELERHTTLPPSQLNTTVDEIILRAEGLPLALEQFSKHVSQKPQRTARITAALPTHLENIYRARLDELPTGAKLLVQSCCVLGVEVPLALLRAMTDSEQYDFEEYFQTLLEKRILEPKNVSVTRFAHQLFQEACYKGLTRQKRVALHQLAHDVLSQESFRQITSFQELARHADGAGAPDLALDYLMKACQSAIGDAAIHTVTRLYFRAKAICQNIGPAANERAAKFAMVAFDAAQQLARHEDLKADIERARLLSVDTKNTKSEILALTHIAMTDWIAGRHQLALDQIEQASAKLGPASYTPLSVYVEFTHANIQFATGDPSGAVDRLKSSINHLSGAMSAAKFGLMISVPGIMARSFASWYMTDVGDIEAARSMSNSAWELSERLDHAYSRLLCQLSRGYIAYRNDDMDEALDVLSRAHTYCLDQSFFGLEPMASAWLSAVLLTKGKIRKAQHILDQSLAAGHHAVVGNSCHYYLQESRARLMFALGEHEEATDIIEGAITRSRAQDDTVHALWGNTVRISFIGETQGWDEPLARTAEACRDEASQLGLKSVEKRIAAAMAQHAPL